MAAAPHGAVCATALSCPARGCSTDICVPTSCLPAMVVETKRDTQDSGLTGQWHCSPLMLGAGVCVCVRVSSWWPAILPPHTSPDPQ